MLYNMKSSTFAVTINVSLTQRIEFFNNIFMKKMFLILAVMMVSLAAQAQEIYVGGGVSLWRNNDIDETSFTITPEVGYELNEKWAIGLAVGFAHKAYDNDELDLDWDGDDHLTSNAFAFAPYARFSFFQNKVVRLFLDMGFGFSTAKVKHFDSVNGFEIGVKPGLAIKLDRHFSLVSKIGFAGYRDDYCANFAGNGFGVALDGEDISLGIEYKF